MQKKRLLYGGTFVIGSALGFWLGQQFPDMYYNQIKEYIPITNYTKERRQKLKNEAAEKSKVAIVPEKSKLLISESNLQNIRAQQKIKLHFGLTNNKEQSGNVVVVSAQFDQGLQNKP